MKNSYTSDFKEQAIIKALQRGDKTLETIANELNVSCGTLKEWLKTKRKTMSTPAKAIKQTGSGLTICIKITKQTKVSR